MRMTSPILFYTFAEFDIYLLYNTAKQHSGPPFRARSFLNIFYIYSSRCRSLNSNEMRYHHYLVVYLSSGGLRVTLQYKCYVLITTY